MSEIHRGKFPTKGGGVRYYAEVYIGEYRAGHGIDQHKADAVLADEIKTVIANLQETLAQLGVTTDTPK